MTKTRFAPSPTGFLHVGGARTALYSWLFARQHAGRFVLRIEDTDQIRSTAESAAGILLDLTWLGLQWEDGPIIGAAKNEYFQSMRLAIYNQHLQELLDKNLAYFAYETKEQLAALKTSFDAQNKPFRYRRDLPGRIAQPQPGVAPVVRFAMPYEDITHHDLVLGDVTVKAQEHDDIVIRKSDGFPTYHFAVVCDDHYMQITHVLRAQEHLMNTFKHIGLYRVFGWEIPAHGHLPLVFNMDNSKMSKREAKVTRAAINAKGIKDFTELSAAAAVPLKDLQDFMAKKSDAVEIAVKLAAALSVQLPEIDVQDFRRSGYLPEALVNFIALVGWSPGGDREIMNRDEMIQLFSLEGIQKTPGRFDRKKLAWMNGEYIRKSSIDRLVAAVESFNEVADTPLRTAPRPMLAELLAMYQERMTTLAEMAQNARFFFEEPVYEPKAVEKHIKGGGGVDFLRQIADILRPVSSWTRAELTAPMERVLSLGEKKGAAAQAMRVALCGGTVSPPLTETVILLGREKTIGRIEGILRSSG